MKTQRDALPSFGGTGRRFALLLVLVAGYVAAFFPAYRAVGNMASALVILPIFAAGWLFGLPAALVAFILGALLDAGLLALTGQDPWLATLGQWPGLLVAAINAVTAGWLHRVFVRFEGQSAELAAERAALRRQVAERERAEAELRAARDGLEQRVADRTAALTDAYAVLAQREAALRAEVADRKQVELDLRKVTRAVEQSPVTVVITDPQGRIEYVNPKFIETSGYTYGEVVGQNPHIWQSGRTARDEYDSLWQAMREGREWHGDLQNRRKNGELYWEATKISPIKDENGVVTHFVAVKEDITERLQAARALQESETRYRVLFEDSPICLWEEDFSALWRYVARLRGAGIEDLRAHFDRHPAELMDAVRQIEVLDANRATLELFRVREKSEILGRLGSFIPETAYQTQCQSVLALAEGKRSFDSETTNYTRDGREMHVWMRWSVAPGHEQEYDRVVVSIIDVGERQRAEEALRASLAEKEVLLKEIHHRVKNNLQVISSLLNLQSRTVGDAQALEVLRDSQNRVRSMALVHEKLYRSRDLAHVDLAEYARNLASYVFRSYGMHTAGLELQTSGLCPVQVTIDTAIACGLIINELVSNSLKYGFPERGPGQVFLALAGDGAGRATLTIGDNGVGLPPGLDYRQTESLGLQLVNTLARQIDATMTVCNDKGLEFVISFPVLRE